MEATNELPHPPSLHRPQRLPGPSWQEVPESAVETLRWVNIPGGSTKKGRGRRFAARWRRGLPEHNQSCREMKWMPETDDVRRRNGGTGP